MNILPRSSLFPSLLSVFLYWIIESNIPPKDRPIKSVFKIQHIQDLHDRLTLSWTRVVCRQVDAASLVTQVRSRTNSLHPMPKGGAETRDE